MEVTVRAAAKINLHLGVGAAREDGFHPLDTVYQAVAIYDDVSVLSVGEPGTFFEGAQYLDTSALPALGASITDRAAALMGYPDTSFIVSKQIPLAGGMAGGSADAAAALVALDRVHDLSTSDEHLLVMAAELGSDVPFALVGGNAHGTGRGELVEPLPTEHHWWWVVVTSDLGLSTPAVYRRWDVLFPDADPTPAPATRVLSALAAGDPVALAAALHNDLEAAAIDLRPELGQRIERGEREGALRGMVSGSGPTCVFLCRSAGAARAVASAMAGDAEAPEGAVLVTHGPVAGAHVLGG